MLFNHERCYDLGMHALVIACSLNTNVFNGLGMDALVIACSLNTNVFYGLGMDALV